MLKLSEIASSTLRPPGSSAVEGTTPTTSAPASKYAEVPTKEFVVRPDHHGILHRITAPITLNPEMYRLDEFDVMPNLVRIINGTTIDCIRRLATADILVMSKSSFSYLAAILNRNGIILYHPFWHRSPSSWMTVGPDGQFDQLKFTKDVRSLGTPKPARSSGRHAYLARAMLDSVVADRGARPRT